MLRKYQSVEKAEPVSPEGHQAIQSELHKVGKTSVQDMTPEEKKNLPNEVDERE